MRITVVGLGYVGLANAVLLARRHDVVAVDIDADRVASVNRRESPLHDPGLQAGLSDPDLRLRAVLARDARTETGAGAYADAEMIVVAAPTDYDPATHRFDTSAVEEVVEAAVATNPAATVVVRSTVPVGFTARLREAHPGAPIVFCPEFLREGHALEDSLHPSRIIAAPDTEAAARVAALFVEGADERDVPVLITGCSEAEAIKLFANTYLALRVAFVNELDTYAACRGLDPAQIIAGIGLDPRIGDHYNNPSFGYGGYCLPKDTRQLQAEYGEIPQHLLDAVIAANETRIEFVTADILRRRPRTVGMHRLVMKAGADNARQSSTTRVLHRLRAAGVSVIVYEPELVGRPAPAAELDGAELVEDLADFKRRADLIVANRWSGDLADVADRVYTRDVYGSD